MFSSRRSHLALLTAVACLVALSATAQGASAAQRYASPDGLGSDCSSEYPCRIGQAVNFAGSGDEVIVAPGKYIVNTTLDNPAPITIHGVAGQPRPRIVLYASGGDVTLHGSTLRYVEVDQEQYGRAVTGWGAKLDQVILKGAPTGVAPCVAAVDDSTIRSSVVIARGGGSAVCAGAELGSTNNTTLRNVTAIATTGVAIEAYAKDTANVLVNVVNTIARTGPSGAGFDVRSEAVGAHAQLTVSNTNFVNYWHSGVDAVYVDGGGNQVVAPSFVDAANGDYRQKPGSVTIDAGHYDPVNGQVDLDGDLRNIGAPDIGADEFVVAPVASTGSASAVTDHGATLAGTVNSKGSPTSYRFEYGTTTAYGSATSDTAAGSGTTDVAAGAVLDGLAPATTYHYRVVASNAAGVATGSDQTFTTAPAGLSNPSDPANAANPLAGAFAGVKLVSTRLTLAGRFITVKLSCPAATAGGCTGRTTLTARHRRAGSRTAATVKLGRAGFSIAPGQQAKLKVRVTRAGRRLFAKSRRLRGRAANAAHSGTGESKTTVAAVTIRKGTR
jgi:hypothetical protein